MTTDEILALRTERGFVSPLAPLEPGEKTLMFAQRGTYEWLCHPDVAFLHLIRGIEVNGKTLRCTVVDCAPLMNGLMIRAQDTDANQQWSDAAGHKVEPILDATPHRSRQAAA